GIRVRHLDEAETAELSRVAILDQGNRFDRAVLGEQRADLFFVGGKGQIAHIDLAHTITTLTKKIDDEHDSCIALSPGSKRFGLVELAVSTRQWRVAKNEKGRSRAGAHYTRVRVKP